MKIFVSLENFEEIPMQRQFCLRICFSVSLSAYKKNLITIDCMATEIQRSEGLRRPSGAPKRVPRRASRTRAHHLNCSYEFIYYRTEMVLVSNQTSDNSTSPSEEAKYPFSRLSKSYSNLKFSKIGTLSVKPNLKKKYASDMKIDRE